MTLGERIAQARKQAGLSQEQLGEKLGVSRQAVSKWEGDLRLFRLGLWAAGRVYPLLGGALYRLPGGGNESV